MGSDRAPKPEIEGAIHAARHYGVHVVLVGREPLIRAELGRVPAAASLPIQVIHASEVIAMEDKAIQAVRAKRDSSLRVGLRLVRERKAAGFVTAGNTGAAMATAKMVLGGLPGVDRPALAAVIPTAVGTVAILLDVGANVDCKPQNLEQFAVMGEIYFRSMFGTRRPRVGLLSIGQEEGKGNDLTREAFPLLKQLPLNFIGNVEGRDLYNGKVDVIVADGFVGNVALKTSEGVANLVRATLKESLKATITRQVGYLLSRSAFADFKKRLDHTEYGGAPLLGVKGVCFITHGSSNANAIKNAIRVAAEFAELRINDKIEKELAQIPAAVTITFADAVRIVRNRGKYMQEAVPVGLGAMAAILGMDLEKVRAICSEAAQGEICEPANINSAEQIVISGHKNAVERATKLASARGAKRAVMLPVSAPFHCSLMKPAQDRLAGDLRALKLQNPAVPVVSNVDAALVNNAESSRDALIRQVTGAVKWEQSMRLLIASGVQTFVEVGPGKVLCGLMRQIDRSKTCLNVADETSLSKAVERLIEKTIAS